jgi:hypothetical protein
VAQQLYAHWQQGRIAALDAEVARVLKLLLWPAPNRIAHFALEGVIAQPYSFG